MRSEQKLQEWMEALAAEGIDREALCNLEAELIGKVGRLRLHRDRAIRDMEAAQLLPLGREVAAIRLGVAPSTVYKMTHRHRKHSTVAQQA